MLKGVQYYSVFFFFLAPCSFGTETFLKKKIKTYKQNNAFSCVKGKLPYRLREIARFLYDIDSKHVCIFVYTRTIFVEKKLKG